MNTSKGVNMISISRQKLIFALSLSLLAAREPFAAASPIDFKDGRLSARIENRPLAEVLQALAATAGARFALSDPGNGQALVSAAVESQRFLEGVKTVLYGFSYAIYPMDSRELPAVIVLSTPPVQCRSGSGATPQRPASGETRVAPMPTVLCQEAAGEAQQAEALAPEQTEPEEILNRSIANLRMKDGQINPQALDQLIGIRDKPNATEALIQAASETQDSRNRMQATEALWRHAADLEFADEASVSALEQLADDANVEVQETARQVLEDMRQFRQHNSSP
jgi:hypothetical protein